MRTTKLSSHPRHRSQYLREGTVATPPVNADDRSDEQCRGVLEACPDSMMIVNRQMEVVLLNAKAERQFGYQRDELLGKRVETIIPEGFAERLIADGRRTPTEAFGQEMGIGMELVGLRKDGSHFPIEMMLTPSESDDGPRVTAAIRDISARKKLEEQLHRLETVETVAQVRGAVAHDFNNILGVIMGNLGLVELLIPTEAPALERVRSARKAAERGAEMIRGLRAVSDGDEPTTREYP